MDNTKKKLAVTGLVLGIAVAAAVGGTSVASADDAPGTSERAHVLQPGSGEVNVSEAATSDASDVLLTERPAGDPGSGAVELSVGPDGEVTSRTLSQAEAAAAAAGR